MTDYPVIFSAAMVQALLAGRKTMTRRLAWMDHGAVAADYGRKLAAKGWRIDNRDSRHAYAWKPSAWQKVKAGDRLWVRETVKAEPDREGTDGVRYLADDNWLPSRADCAEEADQFVALYNYRGKRGASVPAIHVPRLVSRITLIVTSTKTEPLQDISEEDAIAEGVRAFGPDPGQDGPTGSAADAFGLLWAHLHGRGSWDANPEVVATSFKVIKANIDAPEARAA